MRIAIACTYYPFPPSIGGVEAIARNVARELAKRGHEVHIVTSNLDVTTQRPVTDLGIEEREGVIVHKLKPSNFRVGYARTLEGLKETIAKIKPDIVHAHNLHPHLFQSIKWKSKLGYRLVAQLHFPTATGIDHFTARLLFKLVMWNLVKSQYRVDAFIAHTYMEREWLVSEGIEGSRIHVVRFPGVPDKLLKYRPKSNIHEKLSANTVITYISRIHPRKGQHLLVESTTYLKHYLRDFKVYIAGPPSDLNYLRELYALVDKLNLGKNVVIDPRPLSEEEKLDAIGSSDVFACTTLRDIHPIVILEALALKTPVVATDVGAIPEMLNPTILSKEHTETTQSVDVQQVKRIVAITRADPKSISEAIVELVNYSDQNYDKIFNAVIEPYLLSKIVEKLIKIYSDLWQ